MAGNSEEDVSVTQFACALKASGHITCWGQDNHGDTKPPSIRFQQISAGGQFACGVTFGTQAVVCWGDNSEGQLKAPAGAFSQVSAGTDEACALRSKLAAVVCWSDILPLTQGPPKHDHFKQVSTGYGGLACGLRKNQEVTCWGPTGANGPSYPTYRSPSGFTQVSVGFENACAVERNGRAVCWNYGESLKPPTTYSFLALSDLRNGSDNYRGYAYACGLRANHYVVCWAGHTLPKLRPHVRVSNISTGGVNGVCGLELRNTKAIVCWGSKTLRNTPTS